MSTTYTYDHIPRNFLEWIESSKPLLLPPVCNALMSSQELKIMIVGGPNTRSDYHTNPTEEWFYQIKGSMVLKIIDNGHHKDIHIPEGYHFLLPPNTPHSPQRFSDTIGLVVECDRPDGQMDSLSYYCPQCHQENIKESFLCTNLVTQLPPIINGYYASEDQRTCKQCNTIDIKPTQPVAIPDQLVDTTCGKIGVEYPGPVPINEWIQQRSPVSASYHGIALSIDRISYQSTDENNDNKDEKTHPSSPRQCDGETWIYAYHGPSTVYFYDTPHDISSLAVETVTPIQTIQLKQAECLLVQPNQYYRVVADTKDSHAVTVSHIIS